MDFYQRAGIVCRSIPRGKVASYGQIALLCGKPKNARQVGYALNRGKLGEEVPAHRVVNGRGRLTGAASFDTFDMQRNLLEGEGVEQTGALRPGLQTPVYGARSRGADRR